MWFDSWDDLVRVALVGTAAYAALVAVLRLSGKRTLAKLNAFDLVVTVALGSTLATILLSSDVSLTEGVLAFVLLVLLQLVVAWTTTRLPAARFALTSAPTLLLHRGQVREDVLRRHRVSPGELQQAVRASGSGSLADVGAVVLESDGSLSVVPLAALGDGSALADVPGRPDRDERAGGAGTGGGRVGGRP